MMEISKSTLKLWKTYEKKRDEILRRHQEDWDRKGQSPKNIWMFATHAQEMWRRFTLPHYLQEKRVRRWITMAIARCNDALENPDKYPRYLCKPKPLVPFV